MKYEVIVDPADKERGLEVTVTELIDEHTVGVLTARTEVGYAVNRNKVSALVKSLVEKLQYKRQNEAQHEVFLVEWPVPDVDVGGVRQGAT